MLYEDAKSLAQEYVANLGIRGIGHTHVQAHGINETCVIVGDSIRQAKIIALEAGFKNPNKLHLSSVKDRNTRLGHKGPMVLDHETERLMLTELLAHIGKLEYLLELETGEGSRV